MEETGPPCMDWQMHEAFRHLYVHVPFCDGKCSYCAFYSTAYSPGLVREWLDALTTEFDLALARAGATSITPETIYFGGGTPGLLSLAELGDLCDRILERTHMGALREWTLETNPGTLTADKIDRLKSAGVNRVSIGVQSLDARMLENLGRRHGAADVAPTLEALRAAGLGNVGLDLIASLPGVDDAAWRQTLTATAALAPAHLSVYTLTTEPGTVLDLQVRQGAVQVPDAEAQLQALRTAEEILDGSGYERYEISNYARPGAACLHNLSCWRGEDYLGLGPAAASRAGLRRWTNGADLSAYTDALATGRPPPKEEAQLSTAEDACERLMFGLRLREGIDLEAFCKRHGRTAQDLRPRWQIRLAMMERYGLLLFEDGRWRATDRGWEVADSVAAELMLTTD